MSDENTSGVRGASPPRSDDAEIVARIASVVHNPFREVWRRHDEEVWAVPARVLEEGAAAHARALDELGEGGEVGDEGDDALARYRGVVASEVLQPLRRSLRDRDAAGRLEAALAGAAERIDAAAARELPAHVRAPLSATALRRARGLGLRSAAGRLVALVFRPLAWRRESRDVPVVAVARRHLARAVLPRQQRLFRDGQRRRAAWLGDLERAWSRWVGAVLARPGAAPAEDEGADSPAAGPGDREACLRAAGELQRQLDALGRRAPESSGRPLDETLERCAEVLHARVGVAGTFVAGGGDPAPSSRRRGREQAAGWDRWAGEAAARLDLHLHLLNARRRTDAIARELVASLARTARGVDAILDEIDARMASGRERAAALGGDGTERSALVEALGRERRRTAAELGRVEGTLPDPVRLLGALTEAAAAAARRLGEVAAAMPEALVVHRIPPAGARVRRPRSSGHAVRLRDAALQAFDPLRSDRIRAAPGVVTDAIGRVHTVVAELREVVAYGYGAAMAELSEGADPARVHPLIVANALTRAAARAEVARDMLTGALDGARSRFELEVAGGMAHLLRRATTDRLTGRYIDARSRAAAEARRGLERLRGLLGGAWERSTAAFSWVVRRLWPVKRALGIGEGAGIHAELRKRSLASMDEVVERLPMLYRRLFSFDPLTDPRLLVGRDDALGAVEASWNRWRTRRDGALAVIAPAGTGVSSFLGIAARRLDPGAEHTVQRDLRERVRDETELAERVAGWLGLGEGRPDRRGDARDSGARGGIARDLESLGRQVLGAPRGALPRLLVLEGVEHLQMRVAGGGALLEAFLSFIQGTSPRVFWVLSVGTSGWQLLGKRCPACVDDIERIVLNDLTVDELRRAILTRHRLSGLPLRYAEPQAGGELLRGRARAQRGSEKHQRLLESDYFQRLHRAAFGSIRAALCHWLRSADFRSLEGTLLVRPLEALPRFMRPLDLEQSFALKALLDHGTLTVAEYCEVARTSAAETRHLFRTMRELQVVEAVPTDREEAAGRPAPDARHRIRPLMKGAVRSQLKSLNILH